MVANSSATVGGLWLRLTEDLIIGSIVKIERSAATVVYTDSGGNTTTQTFSTNDDAISKFEELCKLIQSFNPLVDVSTIL